MISNWIELSWVLEFSIVIFLIEHFLCFLSNLDEVFDSLLIGEVLVEVILEVLDQVHLFLD